MTKREFDAATKRNMGSGLASDERCNYRTERMRETWGSGATVPVRWPSDYIAERAAKMARRNAYVIVCGTRVYSERDGFLATLGRGSQYRFPQAHRASTGAPLLDGRVRYMSPRDVWEVA